MVQMQINYQGELRCVARHEPSGTEILTDAPVDNQGKGEAFSPTDLAATALASCMLTIMGIAAQNRGIDLKGASASIGKAMTSSPPRRIQKLDVVITVPIPEDHESVALLKEAALNCPVFLSLHPEIEKDVVFKFA